MPGQRIQRGEPLSLRSPREGWPSAPLFHVVLHEPEIPNNTGNIGRTCVALDAALHLVHPLGFSTGERALRRAGLDYWPRLRVAEHRSWADARASLSLAAGEDAEGRRAWAFSARSRVPVWDAEFRPGDALVFGKETAGLPDDILRGFQGRTLTLPLAPGERSLNLATAVCAALYEALRQCVARGDVRISAEGGIDRRLPG